MHLALMKRPPGHAAWNMCVLQIVQRKRLGFMPWKPPSKLLAHTRCSAPAVALTWLAWYRRLWTVPYSVSVHTYHRSRAPSLGQRG